MTSISRIQRPLKACFRLLHDDDDDDDDDVDDDDDDDDDDDLLRGNWCTCTCNGLWPMLIINVEYLMCYMQYRKAGRAHWILAVLMTLHAPLTTPTAFRTCVNVDLATSRRTHSVVSTKLSLTAHFIRSTVGFRL